GGFIQKRLGGIINWLAGGGKLGGYGGGDRVPAMLEAGEYVIRKEAVKKYGQGLFGGLNQMKVNTANIANAVHARLGGMMAVPRFQTPAYQAGGSVNVNFPDIGDYGVVRIESGGQQFPVIMKTDIIGEFKSAIKKERLTRSQ
ncbi:MAG: hypothetical protein U9P90_02340, partial [Patescibacteria group bacterium]|nr:hypothetical protein [Patescibacteria group bacterium]